jgi:hypothetical protein
VPSRDRATRAKAPPGRWGYRAVTLIAGLLLLVPVTVVFPAATAVGTGSAAGLLAWLLVPVPVYILALRGVAASRAQ